jgi:hypothetical protein
MSNRMNRMTQALAKAAVLARPTKMTVVLVRTQLQAAQRQK